MFNLIYNVIAWGFIVLFPVILAEEIWQRSQPVDYPLAFALGLIMMLPVLWGALTLVVLIFEAVIKGLWGTFADLYDKR